MSRLLLTFYGDDLTGSTDALEQLALGGVRAMLFVQVPTRARLKRVSGLQAIGIAGRTRALGTQALTRELAPALRRLKALGAEHVHYKVCSTFDSSPKSGSIGKVLELGASVFRNCVPILAAAPDLGRFTVFGNHFARYGIGSNGAIHRLDRHPSVSRHPATPMLEADLRLHLARQTRRRIALFDVLQLNRSEAEARAALRSMLREHPDGVLFDALDSHHLSLIGTLLDELPRRGRPLFSIGSSAVETTLVKCWRRSGRIDGAGARLPGARSVSQVLIGSGSGSAVTGDQIDWARRHSFAEVILNPLALMKPGAEQELDRAAKQAIADLRRGLSVIVHTMPRGRVASIKAGEISAERVGGALGRVLRQVLMTHPVRRLCIAGGDTASFAARCLGIEAVEAMAWLTPGAPLCRVHADGPPIDGCEMVFKGGQVGGPDYFGRLKAGFRETPAKATRL